MKIHQFFKLETPNSFDENISIYRIKIHRLLRKVLNLQVLCTSHPVRRSNQTR